MTAKLYIEGGGDAKSLKARFREGWNHFFEKVGVGRRVKIVRGGGRKQTFDRFVTAVSEPSSRDLPILLLDSESAVQPEHSVWKHLRTRDNWSRPQNARDDQAFLMVQFMETWFLADREALQRYFGARFRKKELKEWPQLEAVPKATVLTVLDRATAQCSKCYKKGKSLFFAAGEDRTRSGRRSVSSCQGSYRSAQDAVATFCLGSIRLAPWTEPLPILFPAPYPLPARAAGTSPRAG